jgi:hypothetical protein
MTESDEAKEDPNTTGGHDEFLIESLDGIQRLQPQDPPAQQPAPSTKVDSGENEKE